MDLGSLISSVLALIPKLFYLLTMSILSIIDVFQMLFRKLAGLDCFYVDGQVQSGDLVTQFLTGILFGGYPILSSVFLGLIILGAILLILSTIVAIIRNEYTMKNEPATKIIGKAFKSIIFVGIIPIVVIFGMQLANIVLVAVDRATSYNTMYGDTLDKTKLQSVNVATQTFGTGTPQKTYITYNLFGVTDENGMPLGTTNTTFSGTIFKASAYGANRVRKTAGNEDENNFGYILKNGQATDFGGLFSDPSGDVEKIAQKIDIAFGDNVIFAVDCQERLDTEHSSYVRANNNYSWDPLGDPRDHIMTFANKFDVQLVWYYYDLWSFNFIIAIGAALICATIFINIIFGLMRRVVELIGLFMMIPPLIALMPIDGENAYNTWRGKFISKALMAYGAVGGMNIVMLILPEIQKISFFNIVQLDLITNTLLVLIALLAIKDFIKLVSDFVKGEDANAVGSGVAKDVGGLVAKTALMGASVAGLGVGAAALGAKTAAFGLKTGAAGLKGGFQGARAQFAGGKTNKSATAKLKNLNEADDRKKAKEHTYLRYLSQPGSNGKGTKNGELESEFFKTGDNKMLKKTDRKAYDAKLEQHKRSKFEEDLKNGELILDEAGNYTNIKRYADKIFNANQDKHNVTHSSVFRATTFGDAITHVKDASGVKGKAKAIGGAGKTAGIYARNNAVNIGKPFIGRLSMFGNDAIGTFDNEFTNAVVGKDYEVAKNVFAKVLHGKTHAEAQEATKRAKSQAEQARAAKEQYETAVKAHLEALQKFDSKK